MKAHSQISSNGLGTSQRIAFLTKPPLGTATEQDALEVERRKGLCPEVIDGVLVEKTVDFSIAIGVDFGISLGGIRRPAQARLVGGEDGPLRILPDQIRVPDLSFVSRDQFPSGELPDVPVPVIAPDLAVEVLSPSNTKGEMQRKLVDYFTAGVRLVWYVDPREKTVRAYTAPDQCTTLGEDDV